ncbi:nuclear transport factor 2 family protein [Mucilaginibacter aquariorum]|uniref:Nuclear transport factor 2 family protein n=1 Tax=Mucilaginibacter aquariorum TaxID=2967225 RepID=A0ABT1SXE7_9SPHI|nr:nuclear transport factor 2 family protein [Mucilaginibacter aquariorum]MCQ6957026.1 nuclear transport factor 2 family protein [Mucilaginibacter aquariorum]
MKNKEPLQPFTLETALQKVQGGEDAWNSRDPKRIARNYSKNTEWRNRDIFLIGRKAVVKFLAKKWQKELDYKLKKELWAFTDNRIAVRFEYEYRNLKGDWFRAYGNENWEFDEYGLMIKRFASINEIRIKPHERRL